MNAKGVLIGCAAVAGVFVLLLISGVVWWFSTSNTEIRLRNQAEAQQKANELVYDNVWKSIAQVANVNDDYKDSFKEVWKAIMDGQSSAARTASVNVFINRINPKFEGAALSKRLMTTIEGQRKEFLNNQRRLLDIKREHDNIRTTFPGSIVCGGRPELKIITVTSGRASDAFESGRDDDVSLRPSTQKK